MKKFFIGIYFCFFSILGFGAVTTSIEPATIHLGESLRLNITLIDETSENLPDLIPLQADFTIDGTEHRVSYTIINGDAHNSSQWTILLTPKRAGKITIPSIRIGQIQTQAIALQIEGENKKSTEYTHALTDEPIQINTKINNKKPYINQEILYTVKLYNRSPLLNAAYAPPHLDEALMIPLNNREYQTIRNGQTYTVEEQRYAFFPQKSGQQTIGPPSFKALVYGAPAREVHIEGTPTPLDVQSMPTAYSKHPWLPAKSITLTETYDKDVATVKVGQTLVRTITLQGIAIPAELLTLNSIKSTHEYSVYPEKPNLKNTVHGEDVMGTTTIKLTYLFNKSGAINLPGFSITWFNTTTQQEEKAELPAKIIQVKNKQHKPEISIKKDIKSAENATIPLYLYCGLGLLLALSLIAFYYFKPYRHTAQSVNPLKDLKQACLKNNAAETEQALLAWARVQWPNIIILNLNDIQNRLENTVFKKALSELSEKLYAGQSKSWSGQMILACLTAYQHKKSHKKKNKRAFLPDLNPKE